uniref:Uncharacterized protein n=1 Tax=Arundo donax TaxID=35708 RepID=A0A0A9H093_ARUDO
MGEVGATVGKFRDWYKLSLLLEKAFRLPDISSNTYSAPRIVCTGDTRDKAVGWRFGSGGRTAAESRLHPLLLTTEEEGGGACSSTGRHWER